MAPQIDGLLSAARLIPLTILGPKSVVPLVTRFAPALPVAK